MSSTTDLVIEQGTTWAISWPIRDENDQPVDVTGWSVRAHVRAHRDSTEVLHEWSSQLGNAEASGSDVILSVGPSTSSAWNWSDGVYDVELTDPTGNVARVAAGTVRVSREVTR